MCRIPVRNLLSLIQTRFLQTLALPSPSPPSSSLTVQYLTDSCGLRLESAISISQKFQFDEKSRRKSDLVLNLLRAHCFDDAHISQLVEKHPRVLRCQAMLNLKPKLEYLAENGIKGTLLPQLVVSNPLIIFKSLDRTLKPVVGFLKEFLPTDKELLTAVRRSSWLLSFSTKRIPQSNVYFLIDEGVPVICITKLLVRSPRTLFQSNDRIAYAVKNVKSMGIQPESAKFIRALQVYCSLSTLNWKKKLETFKSLGWSDVEALTAFKNDPCLFACSEVKLRSMMDFYTTIAKLDRRTMISNPYLVLYSMDKRVLPRYEIVKLLESKGLIKKSMCFVKLLTLSEKKFFAKFITEHKDHVPELLDMYEASVNERRTTRRKTERLIANQ